MQKTHRKPLSRYFPSHHPKAGQHTYFVEKLWMSINAENLKWERPDALEVEWNNYTDNNFEPKNHTIRAGNNVKAGDFIQFYCWSGKPYRSKQIVIAPPIEVKKVWNINIDFDKSDLINNKPAIRFHCNGLIYKYGSVFSEELSKNDGLSLIDMRDWFSVHPKLEKNTFSGQIICWSNDTSY